MRMDNRQKRLQIGRDGLEKALVKTKLPVKKETIKLEKEKPSPKPSAFFTKTSEAISALTVDEALIDLTMEIESMADNFADPSVRRNTEMKLLSRQVVNELLKVNVKPPLKEYNVKLTKEGGTLVVLFSDWHMGKVINHISGERLYDSEIAHNRIVNELTPTIVEKIKTFKDSIVIDEVVLIFAGDIVENDIIFETQRFRIDSGVAVQLKNVTNAIMEFIFRIRDAFGANVPIRLECVGGNHGRASKASEVGESSWDTAVYAALDLALRYSSIKNVKINYELEEFKLIKIRNYTGLISHAAPPQSETASARAKFGGWYENFNYDFFCYGHRHHWGVSTFNGRPLFMNGSLCGPDDFSNKLAVRDEWSQLMWIMTDSDIVNNLMRLKEKK